MRKKSEIPFDLIENERIVNLGKIYFEVCQLKQLYRQGWLRAGIPEANCESVAEHSFGVALLSLLVVESHFPDLDASRVMKMALLHDLAESYVGDFTIHDNIAESEKASLERGAMKKIFGKLEGGERYIELWEEYERQESREAILVKQIDRLEMCLQALVYEKQHGLNLESFLQSAEKKIQWNELKSFFSEARQLSKEGSKKIPNTLEEPE